MSSRTLDILFGILNQSLYFDAPEGRPTAIASSQVFDTLVGDEGREELASSGSPSIEAVSTTFDQACAEGTQVAYLASTSGLAIDRTYLAANALLGQFEWIAVAGIASGDYVATREPLQFTYASGDTFVSTRISQPLSSSWTADRAKLSGDYSPSPRYRWRLKYTVASVQYVRDVYFDLLRYAGRHDVTPADVNHLAPGWTQRTAEFYRDGRAAIDEAYEAIKFDLYNLDTPDQSIRDRGAVNRLVLLKAVALVDKTPETEKAYDQLLQQLIGWAKVAVATDSAGSAAPSIVRPVWVR